MVPAIDPRRATTDFAGFIVPGALVAAVAVATISAASTGWQGALTIAWLALAIVSWWHPAAGLAIVAAAIPLEQRHSIPVIGADLTAMEFTVWAVAIGAIPRLVHERRLVLDRVATVHGAVVVTLVASIAAGGVILPRWWIEVQGWLLALLVYVIARVALADWRARGLILTVLSVGVVANAGAAVWQRSTGAGPESFVVDGAVRVFGTFQHPNTLGAYLAFVLPMLVVASLATRHPIVWLWRIATIAGVVTLVMTQSRGAMLAFGAAVVVLVVLAPMQIQRWVAIGTVAIALLVVATGSIERMPAVDRFASIVPASGPTQVTPETWGQREREAHWGAAWSMLRSDPVFGVGAGQFNDHFREHTPEWRFRIGRWHAHNGYLHVGAEAGVPGAVAFVAWIGTILAALWRRVLRTSGANALLAAGALASAVAWTVNNVFEYQDVPSIPIMFVLVVAIGLGGAGAMGSLPARAETTGEAS